MYTNNLGPWYVWQDGVDECGRARLAAPGIAAAFGAARKRSNTMNHTPGPWTLSDEDSPLLSGADGAYIAQVFSRTANGNLRPHYAADAALIAAAPDLLAALQAVADYWAGGDVPPELDRAMRDAIARATGED